jgi:FtsZ-binding cell division protein ZapB
VAIEIEKTRNVCIAVNELTNKKLTHSAKSNNRAKKREALARLEHHLKLFGNDWESKR